VRTIIVGGPRSGKSTLARDYRSRGIPTFCGDPLSEVKEPESDVHYLPEGMGLGPDVATRWIAENWFTLPGPWLMEGQIMARALRKWTLLRDDRWRGAVPAPCDRIIVFREVHPLAQVTPGQLAMGKGVQTVWGQVEHHFRAITEYR